MLAEILDIYNTAISSTKACTYVETSARKNCPFLCLVEDYNKKIWFTHAVMIIRKIMTSHSFGNECFKQFEFFIEIIVTYFEYNCRM